MGEKQRENLIQSLQLPDEVYECWVSTLKELSTDDTSGNSFIADDEWAEEQLVNTGWCVYKSGKNSRPHELAMNVITSEVEALDMDNISKSYSLTQKKKNPLRTNETLETVDALCFQRKEDHQIELYLIEFKNGEWNYSQIKEKIQGSIQILSNLNVFDECAILSSNREKEQICIPNLRASEKFKDAIHLESTFDFYKENAHVMIVYSKANSTIKCFKDLYKLKNEFEDVEAALRKLEYNPYVRKEKYICTVKPEYEKLNGLMSKILSTSGIKDSEYCFIRKAIDIVLTQNKLINDIFNSLRTIEKGELWVDWLWRQMAGKDSQYQRDTKDVENQSLGLFIDDFLIIALKRSIQIGKCVLVEKQYELSDYEFIVWMLKDAPQLTMEFSAAIEIVKFVQKYAFLFQEVTGIGCILKDMINIKVLLNEMKFEDAARCALLIKR